MLRSFTNTTKTGSPGGSVGKNRLPVLGTRAPSLVQVDPTGRGATKPVRHNPRASAREPGDAAPETTCRGCEAHTPQSACSTPSEATAVRSPALQLQRTPARRDRRKAHAATRPSTAKNKQISNLFKKKNATKINSDGSDSRVDEKCSKCIQVCIFLTAACSMGLPSSLFNICYLF